MRMTMKSALAAFACVAVLGTSLMAAGPGGGSGTGRPPHGRGPRTGQPPSGGTGGAPPTGTPPAGGGKAMPRPNGGSGTPPSGRPGPRTGPSGNYPQRRTANLETAADSGFAEFL